MNLVEMLDKSIKDQDWNLVKKVLYIINGNTESVKDDNCNFIEKTENKNPFMVNKPAVVKTQSSAFKPLQNKFVDDLSLESDLIEKSPNIKKNYRKPSESMYVDVQCCSCNKSYSVTKEEHRFRSSDSESVGFTCIKCIRTMGKR